jgi:hypothetical protein
MLVTLIFLVLKAVGVCVSLVLFLYLVFRVRKTWRGWHRGATPLPGPPAMPFLGNVLEFIQHKRNTLPLFMKWQEKYGNTYRFTVLGDRDIILINDPESIKHVLRCTDHVHARAGITHTRRGSRVVSSHTLLPRVRVQHSFSRWCVR